MQPEFSHNGDHNGPNTNLTSFTARKGNINQLTHESTRTNDLEQGPVGEDIQVLLSERKPLTRLEWLYDKFDG